MADIRATVHPPWFTILVLSLLPALAACSVIYSAGDFERPDADMTPDADLSPCADDKNTELTLIDIVRAQVYEGEGCIMEGDACGTTSRPVPLVVRGCNIPADAAVTLSGAGFTGTPADTTIGPSGRFVGFTIRVPVDTELGKASSEEVTVTIADSSPLTFTVRGLDELVHASTDPLNIVTNPLEGMYSRIEISSLLTITGDKDRPARFVATSEIVLGADVNVEGNDATGSTGGAGGPGGCKGGDAETAGACGESGAEPGASGTQGNGGGGGGHAEAGSRGGGDQGGPGGFPTGNRTLSPLAGTAELGAPRGQGGGGGGDGEAAVGKSTGGAGGGGGGVIELTSWGKLDVIGEPTLLAKGGDGAAASTACQEILPGLLGGGGGGGGGSGGTILVRAAIVDQALNNIAMNVAGGMPGAGNSCHAGGAGALGRVRMDLPGDDTLPAAFTALPVVSRYRGPVIAPDLPAIVTERTVTVTVHGGLSEDYWIERRTLPVTAPVTMPVTIQAGQSATVNIDLAPGYNELCALVVEDNTPVQPEGRNCLAIAYIP
jgi:hypothetical protein